MRTNPRALGQVRSIGQPPPYWFKSEFPFFRSIICFKENGLHPAFKGTARCKDKLPWPADGNGRRLKVKGKGPFPKLFMPDTDALWPYVRPIDGTILKEGPILGRGNDAGCLVGPEGKAGIILFMLEMVLNRGREKTRKQVRKLIPTSMSPMRKPARLRISAAMTALLS